jgi:G patch domain-containing protein 1
MEVEPELAPEKVSEIVIPPLSPRTASSALHGFMPHGDDPHKQERYRSYLVSQTYNTKHPNPQLLPSTNIEDVNNELESFAQSARIFRPMSHAMSSRFTSGSSSLASTDTQQPKAGLHILDPKGPLMQFAKASTEVEPEKTLTPREQAAADGKFGALTRVVKDFYPVKLVCKRFHVPNPHPEGPPEGGDSGSATPAAAGGQSSSAGGPSWMSGFVHQVETEKENKPPSEDEKEEEFTGERLPRSINEVGMAEDANQGRDILTYVKPSIDIFKAIFASDDEDDDDDDQPKPPTVPSVPSKFASRKQDASNQPQPEEKPVDYNTFKPVFRRTDEVKPEDDKDKTQRKKEKKDKKKRKGALSFDVGDNDEEAPREKPKKKAKSRREEVAEEWVEKAPVVLPQSAPAAVPSSNQTEPSTNEADQASSVPKFVRKGAADLW